jgi:pimeloyl-ACP methyl ester carboxylesterase
MHYLWPRLLRRHVEARYLESAARARGRFGAATVEGAVRRALEMGPLSHVARCARCVRPFQLRQDFISAAQLVATVCVVGGEDTDGCGTAGAASGAAVCAGLGLAASRLVVVPASGRQCFEEQPQAVAAVLLALVAEAAAKLAALGLADAGRHARAGAALSEAEEGVRGVGKDQVVDPDDFATF